LPSRSRTAVQLYTRDAATRSNHVRVNRVCCCCGMAPLLPPVAGASPRSLIGDEHERSAHAAAPAQPDTVPLFPSRYRPLPLDKRTEPSRRLLPSSVDRAPGAMTYYGERGEMLGQGPQLSARSAENPWWWPQNLVWRAPARQALVAQQQWEERYSATHQRAYWVETSTRETTWKKPVEAPPSASEAPDDEAQSLTPRRAVPTPPRTPRTAVWLASQDGPQSTVSQAADSSPFKLLAAVTGPGRATLTPRGEAREWVGEWIEEWVSKAVPEPEPEPELEPELEPQAEPLSESQAEPESQAEAELEPGVPTRSGVVEKEGNPDDADTTSSASSD
jgi:hypothetical protein